MIRTGFVTLLFAVATISAQAPVQTLEGILTVVWGDPQPGSRFGGETAYGLALPDGRRLSLRLAGQDAAAVRLSGKRVIVTGRQASTQTPGAVTPRADEFLVEAITPGLLEPFLPEAPVVGTKRVIYLLVKFSDDSAGPHPPGFFTDLTNPDTPPVGAAFPTTINGFFKKTSYNQFSWVADVGGAGGLGAPDGWLTLPHAKNFYAPCDFGATCANLSLLATEATALGRAQGINFLNYDNINFVLSNDLDCCAWGGTYVSAVDHKTYGATWEPPWGQNATTYSHELTHSIGLPHSGWVYYAYDSPWDVMSAGPTASALNCGTYHSINNGGRVTTLSCSEPGSAYIGAHSDYLGWLPAANQVVTSTGVTVPIEAMSLPLGSAFKMIKICLSGFSCTGSTAHYLTVEVRVKGLGTSSQFDNGLPGEGVIIHDVQMDRSRISGSCFFNNQSGWAVPVDSTPGDYDSARCAFGSRVYPNRGLYNAQWSAGQTYTSTTYGLSVAVLSRTGSTALVSVQFGTARPAIATHPANQIITAGQNAVFTVVSTGTPTPTFQWLVSTTGGLSWTNLTNTAPYSGATTPTLAITAAARSLTGNLYRAIATNVAGTAESNAAILSVTSASDPRMALDRPASGATGPGSFAVSGWAVDLGAGTGGGADVVHVYAFPGTAAAGFGAGIFLGVASAASPRPDVGAVFGSQFGTCGFLLQASGLASGNYRIVAYSHSALTGAFGSSRFADITVTAPVSRPAMSLDGPADGATVTQPFLAGGWAVDLGAASGTGIDAVHVWAFRVSDGAAFFVAQGTAGGLRADVGGVFGSAFSGAGFTFVIQGLSPGLYDLAVYARSTIAGTFNQMKVARITIR